MKHLDSQKKISARHVSWIAYLQQFMFVIRHQSGQTNKVADALSRPHTLLSTFHTSALGLANLADQYASDPFFCEDMGGCAVSSSVRLCSS